MSPISSMFETLPSRPPTPPKDISDAVDDALDFLSDGNEIEETLQRPKQGSPDVQKPSDVASPTSSQGRDSASNTSKRVGFSPHPTYHNPGHLSSPASQLRKRSMISSGSKALRSILKPSIGGSPLTPDDLDTRLEYFSPQDPTTFASMLNSVIKQLAGPTVSGRLDAYLALNGAMRVYEGIPDPDAMNAKMDILVQFMARDMSWKNAGGALETNIVTQALKLIGTILSTPRLFAALDDDFRILVIDRSITVVESPDMSKAIVKMHSWLLAQPGPHSRFLTGNRVDRTLSALKNIEDRCSGNTTVAARLRIYQRLLENGASVMMNRMRDWVEHIFHGFLSSIKDVRLCAIDTCTTASMLFGSQPHAAKVINELLDTEVEKGQNYGDWLGDRLKGMVSSKETGPLVPRIWAAVILFYRHKARPLQTWPRLKSWLLVLQQCLNASDPHTKHQAHLAWNKLVFAVMPDAHTSQMMFNMLRLPLAGSLDKKLPRQSRDSIWDCYYNLLHYALRPSLTFEEKDAAWDMYVASYLSDAIRASAANALPACRVIIGLLTSSSGTWNANAANENIAIQPEDLPRLDPRWVRSRTKRLVETLTLLSKTGTWETGVPNFPFDSAFEAFVVTVADAGSQEIKTSNELKTAVADIVGMLASLWPGLSLTGSSSRGAYLSRYCWMIKFACQSLGLVTFAEDFLVVDETGAVRASTTPSRRSSKHPIPTISPLLYLLGVSLQTSAHAESNHSIDDARAEILDLILLTASTAASRLSTLLQCVSKLKPLPAAKANTHFNDRFWAHVVSNVKTIVTSQVINNLETDASKSAFVKQVVGLVAQTTSLSGQQRTTAIEETTVSLLQHLLAEVLSSLGAAGTVVTVVEPVSSAVLDSESTVNGDLSLQVGRLMITGELWVPDQETIDDALRRYCTHSEAAAADAPKPYECLGRLAVSALESAYSTIACDEPSLKDTVQNLMRSVIDFGGTANGKLRVSWLGETQHGIAVWIEDAGRKTSKLADMLLEHWETLLSALSILISNNESILTQFEPVLLAGFLSPHSSVVTETVRFWNETMKLRPHHDYTTKLAAVLQARQGQFALRTPGFPEADTTKTSFPLPSAFENTTFLATSVPENQALSVVKESSPVPQEDGVAILPDAAQSSAQRTLSSSHGSSKRRKAGGSRLSGRLRHDDSQVQFAPIRSPPPLIAAESQHLTEHQREILDQQQVNARMFPDMSSSPLVQQPLTRSINKRLDFAVVNNVETRQAETTPTKLVDGVGMMSDEIPSSPTPSSTRDPDNMQIDIGFDGADDEDAADPPSSPPERSADDVLDDDPADGPEFTLPDALQPDEEFAGGADMAQLKALSTNGERETEEGAFEGNDALPSVQLQQEAEDAAESQGLLQLARPLPDDINQPELNNQQSASECAHSVEGFAGDERQANVEDSRVDDSFVDPAMSYEPAASTHSSQGSHPSGRKRKRPASTIHTARKRKQSPLKRIFSTLLGRSSQDDNDDDMEDEIVVASSQRSTSPVQSDEAEEVKSEPPLDSSPIKGVFTQSQDHSPAVVIPSTKRRRGRPRKSTPVASSMVDDQVDSSQVSVLLSSTPMAVDDGPASANRAARGTRTRRGKARKTRQGRDAKLVSQASLSTEQSDQARLTRRRAAGLEANCADRSNHEEHEEHDDEDEEANELPVEVEVNGREQAAEGRPIASPRSILGRLRNILSDLPSLLLGSHEEREIDDVLFEIRREVHDAGRRGRT